mgnify:CR=1 FL=1
MQARKIKIDRMFPISDKGWVLAHLTAADWDWDFKNFGMVYLVFSDIDLRIKMRYVGYSNMNGIPVIALVHVMREAHWHRFQVLTKRAEKLEILGQRLSWPANVWMSVTVENDACRGRIDSLRRVPAAVRFLSLELLLSALPALDLEGIDWVIVGGESGPGARPMAKEWVEDIREQCERHGVAFFFKQWGGVNKKKAGRILHGPTWDGMPAVAGS